MNISSVILNLEHCRTLFYKPSAAEQKKSLLCDAQKIPPSQSYSLFNLITVLLLFLCATETAWSHFSSFAD